MTTFFQACKAFRSGNKAKQSTLQLDGLESLERREMLAGDVNAQLTGGGDLRIDGDAADNHIVVTPVMGGGIRITGHGGTTVNGANEVVLPTLEPVVADDIVIRMRGGHDLVEFVTISATDDMRVNMGSGDDTLTLLNVTVPNDLSIVTGSGDDLVAVVDTYIAGGHFRVTTGSGDDAIIFPQCSTSAGRVTLNTGSGEDQLLISGAINDRLSVNMGRDADVVAFGDMGNLSVDSAHVNLGGGDDTVAFATGSQVESGRLNGGGGADLARIATGVALNLNEVGIEGMSASDPAADVVVSIVGQFFSSRYVNRGGDPLMLIC